MALQRLEALEGLAAAGAAAVGASASSEAGQAPEQAGGVLAVAGSLKQLQVSKAFQHGALLHIACGHRMFVSNCCPSWPIQSQHSMG